MNTWQKKIYEKSTQKRDKIFRPISFILSKFKITPNLLTLAGITSMLFFVFFIQSRSQTVILFVFLSLLFDMLDGTLARYQKISSDKGKFIDVSADCFNFCLFLFGLALAEIVSPIIITPLIFFTLISRTLRIFYNSFDYSSNWIFRPVAGLLPNLISFSSYALFALEIFLKYGILYSQIFPLFSLILSIDSGRYFYKILQKR